MVTSTSAVGARWWAAAGIVGGLVTGTGVYLMHRALLFEVRTTGQQPDLDSVAIAFIATAFAALQWGLYFLTAIVAAIILRRAAAVAVPPLLVVFVLTICAQAPTLISHLLSWRALVRAERLWEAAGGQVDPELIWIRLQPTLAGDLASTVGVSALLAVLLTVRCRHLPLRTVVPAALAPIIVTLISFVISLAAP